jgi:hypothetical protein
LESWRRSQRERRRKTFAAEDTGNDPISNDEQRNVLKEPIITLIRKRVLTDAEGEALLQKLLLRSHRSERDRIYKFEPSKGFGNRSRICKTSIFPFKLARVTGTSPQNSQMS